MTNKEKRIKELKDSERKVKDKKEKEIRDRFDK
jgi:hypothetical protein